MKFQIGAMTVGDILDRGFKILQSRLGAFYLINLLVLSPVILMQIALPEIAGGTGNELVGLLLSLVALALLLILQPIGQAAVLCIIAQEYVDRRVTLGEAFRFALTKFGPLLGTSILAGLTIMVGFMLCLVPGVIFALNYAVIAQVVVVEGTSGQPAMKRSTELVKGWRGRVFGILLLTAVLSGVVGAVLGYLLPTQTLVRTARGLTVGEFNHLNHLIQVVASQLVGILFTTYQAICITLIYFDLRVRKEGFDLELAARQQVLPAEAL